MRKDYKLVDAKIVPSGSITVSEWVNCEDHDQYMLNIMNARTDTLDRGVAITKIQWSLDGVEVVAEGSYTNSIKGRFIRVEYTNNEHVDHLVTIDLAIYNFGG